MNTIKVTSAAEYEQATKIDGKNKIEMDYFEVLSNSKDNTNIRHESGYEIWKDGEIIGACSSSAPVYCVNQYGTTDNRAKYGYTID
jgi:hypothetical protein